MEDQMQLQSTEKQTVSQSQNQKPKGYFDAFGDAFRRILKNKTLWIWGIFLTAGGGGSFTRLGSSPDIEDGTAPAEFLAEFWWVIPIAIGVGLLIGIAFWIFSTIVRPGVIRALDRLQNNSDSEVKHRDIWDQGRAKFIEIIKLDLMIILMSLGFFIALAISIAILIGIGVSFKSNIAVIILVLLGVIFFAVFIFITIILSLIRTFGTVFVSLGDMNWSIVVKTSYLMIKKNKMEAFKLILINILISMIGGIVGMIVIGIISAILIGLSIAIMLALKPLGIFLLVVSGIVILVLVLFLKAFVSLWSQDVVVWWVKKMQGVEIFQEKNIEEKIEEEKELVVDEKIQPDPVVSQGDLVMESKK